MFACNGANEKKIYRVEQQIFRSRCFFRLYSVSCHATMRFAYTTRRCAVVFTYAKRCELFVCTNNYSVEKSVNKFKFTLADECMCEATANPGRNPMNRVLFTHTLGMFVASNLPPILCAAFLPNNKSHKHEMHAPNNFLFIRHGVASSVAFLFGSLMGFVTIENSLLLLFLIFSCAHQLSH